MAKFRTKARAVELLGKGQIADLPTAISELWKNGYDAYADSLACSLYLEGYKDLEKPMFTLSDDGVGMSKKDLLEKWIVLGTDSKSRGAPLTRREDRLGKEPRIPMGEKGIGRLSVAYLGNQMLMITKKVNYPCQALFLDWRILENYNLYIDDLEIPIEEIKSQNEFYEVFKSLKEQFATNLRTDFWTEQHSLRNRIQEDLNSINTPYFFYDEILKEFLLPDSHGTLFLIFTPHEQLIELVDFADTNKKDKSTIVELRKLLSGLYNVMKGDQNFSTTFDIHTNGGKYNLLDEFFTPEELKICDHYINGKFDDKGFFDGEVRVFNKVVSHQFKPVRPPGSTSYGPFEIELGVIEGNKSASRLTEEQWNELNKKTELFGGLYIYRDGFRVLPYGKTEYDFLEFEKRRSKSAGYYFFSQRNMLGYISISRITNPNLIDKAGREGFITNKAFREFKADLMDFFIDLSMKFFRSYAEKSEETNLRNQQLDEIRRRNERMLLAEQKKSKQTRKKFLEELKEYSAKILQLQEEIESLSNELLSEAGKTEVHYNKYQELVERIDQKKDELRSLKIQKPKRVKITENQENKLSRYNEQYSAVFFRIEEAEKSASAIRQRFDVQNLRNEFLKKYNNSIREISIKINRKRDILEENFQRLKEIFDIEKAAMLSNFKSELSQYSLAENQSKALLQDSIKNIGGLVDKTIETAEQLFNPLLNHISNLNLEIDDDLLVGWYKEQNEKIQEKLEMTNELAQLGMSIEIIDHQFNVMYAHMKEAIDSFRTIAEKNPEYEYSFNQLKTSYEHLANNHKLLVPLFRTKRRNRTQIKGKEIISYLRAFFNAIFEKNKIELSSDQLFDEFEFYTFESIIMPVFINVVNNAVYWLIPVENRHIHITVLDGKVLIMNNGERIEDRFLEDIFALFFSRRSEGRGIGLYLARTNLRSEGLDLIASNDKDFNKLQGACFIIKPYYNNQS